MARGQAADARAEGGRALALAEESDLWGIHWQIAEFMAGSFGREAPELWRTAAASVERYADAMEYSERGEYLKRAGVSATLLDWAERARESGLLDAVRSLEGAARILS
jgi:hypothetical protein